jgi:ring-1,2-phenylacetyl-CoA epoxidase subunit PaaC
MTASIKLYADGRPNAETEYLLRLADLVLIHAQRLSEWCGHAPVLEEDIALTNLSLDLIGQARALFTLAGGQLAGPQGRGFDEDQLAFLRDERDYRNAVLAELPLRKGGGDFADTVLRNLLLATWLRLAWQRLLHSRNAELAAIAAKALKEATYHCEHAADWVVRLGDGTEESARRMRAALQRAWPYVAELFADDAVDEAAAQSGLGPRSSELREGFHAALAPVWQAAGLTPPEATPFATHGKQGRHSEHLGPLLAEMQVLQRAYPGGTW